MRRRRRRRNPAAFVNVTGGVLLGSLLGTGLAWAARTLLPSVNPYVTTVAPIVVQDIASWFLTDGTLHRGPNGFGYGMLGGSAIALGWGIYQAAQGQSVLNAGDVAGDLGMTDMVAIQEPDGSTSYVPAPNPPPATSPAVVGIAPAPVVYSAPGGGSAAANLGEGVDQSTGS